MLLCEQGAPVTENRINLVITGCIFETLIIYLKLWAVTQLWFLNHRLMKAAGVLPLTKSCFGWTWGLCWCCAGKSHHTRCHRMTPESVLIMSMRKLLLVFTWFIEHDSRYYLCFYNTRILGILICNLITYMPVIFEHTETRNPLRVKGFKSVYFSIFCISIFSQSCFIFNSA